MQGLDVIWKISAYPQLIHKQWINKNNSFTHPHVVLNQYTIIFVERKSRYFEKFWLPMY